MSFAPDLQHIGFAAGQVSYGSTNRGINLHSPVAVGRDETLGESETEMLGAAETDGAAEMEGAVDG